LHYMLEISNIVLEKSNITSMKKSVLIFIVAGLVLLSTGMWIYSSAGLKAADMLHFGVIFLLIAFAVFVGIKRLSGIRNGQPAEDEMSKKILRRTASHSYYISLYLWVFILFLKDRVSMDSEELIGAGILGMAITYAVVWVFLYFRGIRNE